MDVVTVECDFTVCQMEWRPERKLNAGMKESLQENIVH